MIVSQAFLVFDDLNNLGESGSGALENVYQLGSIGCLSHFQIGVLSLGVEDQREVSMSYFIKGSHYGHE